MEATKQIFVKGLPAETSNEDIENYFSEVGPIRRCFIITTKGSKVCNGMAYVWYALPEHALLAVKEKNNKPFKNKIIQVQVAKSKQQDEKDNKDKNNKKQSKDQKQQQDENNQDDSTTTTPTTNTTTTTTTPAVVVTKKPIEKKKDEFVIIANNFVADKKIINHFLSLKEGTITTVFPIPYSNSSIRIICDTLDNANKVLAKLSKGKEYNGKVVSFALESDHVKINELIIRNLSFTTNVQHLVDKFSPIGEVLLIKLPTKQGTSTNKGFGFVLYKNREDAVKALAELNNTKINNRQVAIDWAVPQEQYKSIVNEKVEVKDQEMEDKDENDEDDDEEEEEQDDEDDEEMDDEDDDEEGDDDDDDEDDEDMDDEDDEDDKASKREQKKKEKEEWEKSKERNVKEVNEMKTIFIRNLAFDTTQEELESKFEQFGKMEFCRLVLDKVTNKPTGKAFIKFIEKSSAERAYHECQAVPLFDPTLEEKINKSNDKKKNNKKNQTNNQLASLLQGGIMVGGRHLNVDYAVDHQKASDFKAKKIENLDKKNRHLLNIGKILQGSKEGAQLTDKDWKLRSEADKENNTKLKVNPNYYVSPTRLCFRNIPLHINDINLKHACMKALKEKDSKAKIVFSKVTVDKERLSADGKPKSKGFGFVEFNTHDGALAALHVINNNSKIFYNQQFPKSKDYRPFVQFAVEDARAVKIQKEYHEKLRAKQKTQKYFREQEQKKNMNSSILNDAEAGQKLGRGQKQRLKKRLAREKLESQGINVEQLNKEKEQQKLDKLRRQQLASLPKTKVTQQSQEKEIKKIKESKKFTGKRKDDFDDKAQTYRKSFDQSDRPIKKKKWLQE